MVGSAVSWDWEVGALPFVTVNACTASDTVLTSARQAEIAALALMPPSANKTTEAKTPMTTMTTSNSIRVKPCMERYRDMEKPSRRSGRDGQW